MRPATSKNSRPLRVLHCPWNVAGNPGALARAERQLGVDSHCIEIVLNEYEFKADETLGISAMGALGKELQRWHLLWRAMRHFDVIHFNFGQTILMTERYPDPQLSQGKGLWGKCKLFFRRQLWLADLPLLKFLGKGIVMTYQGDDARQGDECRRRFAVTAANYVGTDYYNPMTDTWKRKAIAKVARYADRIYALNPDLLHVLPPQARFLPYANVDHREWTVPRPTPNTIPVVVHAPTHRGVKGTEFVMEAVRRLHSEGIPFQFQLIENLLHTEARQFYERADVLVDQLLLGWYGGLAVEFMALQKPVVCYLRDEDLNFLPPSMRAELPIVNANQTNLYEVLKDLLTIRRTELAEIGRRGRAYVERWHDPVQIAHELAHEYHAIANRRWKPKLSSVEQRSSSQSMVRANHGEINEKAET
jgi:hypothetical protein